MIAVLSLTGGMAVGKVLDFTPIFYVETFIGIFFFVIPYLPKYLGLDLTICLFFTILNAALVFYGILLGPLSEIHLLVAFLLGASCYLLRGKKLLLFPAGMVVSMLIFLELNYYNHWFKPLDISYRHAILVRWIVVFTGSSLSAVTIFYFVKSWVNSKFYSLTRKIAEQNVELASAIECKSRYVDMLSHELRTPLNSILGIAQLLNARRSDFDHDTQVEVQHLLESTLISELIVNNSLDFSRINSGKQYQLQRSTVDLKDLIESTFIMQRYVANSRGVKIQLNYQEGLPPYIVTDEVLCLKIFNNLFSNLVKYAPANTTAEIRVTCDNKYLYVQTINSGSIDAGLLHKIFDAFESSAVEVNSTGLGLFLSRSYARMQQGDITVQSENGQTIFCCKLPLEKGEAKNKKTQLFSTPGSLRGYSILAVDDDRIERDIISKRIAQTGAACVTVGDMEEAKAYLSENTPSLILTDYQLTPTSNCLGLIDYIRGDERLKEVPVIILSGDSHSNAETVRTLRADGALTKPYSTRDLESILRQHLVPVRLLLKR
ncbi:ATP-binding protein [Chitinophaga sp. CB10]|uniref:hybrid sensor histidine kinase/response regulator n=1 Tax=Chitinophaga sp. CB10 TaxID=1891659 RepID=UPI0025BC0811|nr:ATP-binding protein [Chitinophaga sp. CB10]